MTQDPHILVLHFLKLFSASMLSILLINRIFLGVAHAKSLQGLLADVPLMFTDKQLISINIPNAYLDGDRVAIPYTYCEVYAPLEIMSKVPMPYCRPHCDTMLLRLNIFGVITSFSFN